MSKLIKYQKSEYKFLEYCIKIINQSIFGIKDLENIYKEFKKFVNNNNLDELALLRKGELMLGEYCEVNTNNLQDVYDLLLKLINNLEEIETPVLVVTIGALAKIALAKQNNEELNFNDIKKENDNNDL